MTSAAINRLSRRQWARWASVLAGGAAFPFGGEFALAQSGERQARGRGRQTPGSRTGDPSAVRLTSNENPLGPSREALDAIAKVAPFGWRYSAFAEQDEFIRTVAETQGVKEAYIGAFAGTSDPLRRVACAFTGPARGWVMADPGYGSGAPEFIGSRTIRVPLRADLSHDAEAMIAADPNAGAYFVCNPNNPSGSLTPRRDIEYLLAHKRRDAVVLVDEAYIEYDPQAEACTDLVNADKDILVLRTFSKIYGMAGLRAGYALGRPDLLAKLRPWGDGKLPITGLVAATASLKVAKTLVPERRAINARIRETTFEYLDRKKIPYIPTRTNFFMMEVHRPGAEFAQAMAKENVLTGRVWPAWPTKVRVTVGTQAEMELFQAACDKVYSAYA